MSIREDIDQALKDVYYEFDLFCKKIGTIYRIITDEANIQSYLTKGKKGNDELKNYIEKVCRDHNVHMEVDEKRKDGVMYTFTLDSLTEMGSWQLLPKRRKSEDYSPFANKSDARRVRQGKTMYQRKFSERLDDALRVIEDQYKSPNKRHTLKQSPFRSSFGPSRSFGGISTVREMIMPKIDQCGNPGLVSAQRTTVAGSKKEDYKTRPYPKRKDLTDLPKTVKKESFIQSLSLTLERATKGTSLGRCRDKRTRTLIPKPVVPCPTHECDDPAENLPVEAQQHWGTYTGSWSQAVKGVSHSSPSQRTAYGETERQAQGTEASGTQGAAKNLINHPLDAEPGYVYQVVNPDGTKMTYTNRSMAIDYLTEHPGSTAEYVQGEMTQGNEGESMDDVAGLQNMRPLGEFGPVKQTAPKGNVVSNVRVQHPPTRSFDASSPRISIQSSPV